MSQPACRVDSGMRGEEGVELGLVAGADGLQEFDEQGRRLHEEHRRRDHHQIGGGAAAEIESERHAAHIALFVVGGLRVAAAEREAGGHGNRLGEMRRLGECRGLGRGGELPRQAKAFGMRGAHAGMHAEHAVQRADQVGRSRVCRGRGLPAREKAEADD